MTVSVASATAGSWSQRIGMIAGMLNDQFALQGGPATTNVAVAAACGLPPPGTTNSSNRVKLFEASWAAGTADYADLDGFASAAAQFQSSSFSPVAFLAALAVKTTITMCNQDTVLAGLNLSYAFQLLIQQAGYVAGAAPGTVAYLTALIPAIGAQTVIAGSGTAVNDPSFVFSLKDTFGSKLQYIYPELLKATITNDVQNGATAGNEPWLLTGQVGQPNKLSWDWLTTAWGSVGASGGNGGTVSGTLVSAAYDNQGGFGNLTVNGDFRRYNGASVNIPDNWVLWKGVDGTNIVNSSATAAYLSGGGSVEILGDGTTNFGIKQPFNTTSSTVTGAGGSPAVLQAAVANNAQYCVSVFLKNGQAAPASGTVRLSVVNSSNTIVNDDYGTALSAVVDMSSGGVNDTNWHQLTLTFRLPQALPTGYAVSLDTSVLLTSAKIIYASDLCVCQMQQLYNGGPYVAAFAGTTAPNASGISPYSWSFAVTNTITAGTANVAANHTALQIALWRLFDPANLPPAQQGKNSPYFMLGNGYSYPNVNGGGTLIADTVVA
jgi:hypothetical protein